MNKAGAALAALALSCIPAAAQENKPQIGEWYCLNPSNEDIRDVQFIGETWRVNNLTLKEGLSPLLDSPSVTFSASIANRSSDKLDTSIEVMGLAASSPIFALSARPIFPVVEANANGEAKGYTLSNKGELAKADKICIRAKAFVKK